MISPTASTAGRAVLPRSGDLDKDSYIFTNREGIKLRELTVPQLVTLIEHDLVDILERKTSFRETLAGHAGQDLSLIHI